jgi:uncharacterized protein (UPF0335 family)
MSNGASDETIAAYVIDLIELDSQSDEIQKSKKRTYDDARETYGKKFARSLKRAVALHRMDADKRAEADEIDVEAERFLEIIRKPRAPRATRTREIIEEIPPHDADGVILETSSQAIDGAFTSHGRQTPSAGTGGEADRQPIHAPRYEAAE